MAASPHLEHAVLRAGHREALRADGQRAQRRAAAAHDGAAAHQLRRVRLRSGAGRRRWRGIAPRRRRAGRRRSAQGFRAQHRDKAWPPGSTALGEALDFPFRKKSTDLSTAKSGARRSGRYDGDAARAGVHRQAARAARRAGCALRCGRRGTARRCRAPCGRAGARRHSSAVQPGGATGAPAARARICRASPPHVRLRHRFPLLPSRSQAAAWADPATPQRPLSELCQARGPRAAL